MMQVILDTSSLMALALAEREAKIPIQNTLDFWQAHGGLDGAIEAFVLYDRLLLDGPSIQRNIDRLPRLGDLAQYGSLVALEGEETAIYKAMNENYINRIITPTRYVDYFEASIKDWSGAELGAKKVDPSSQWRDVRGELNGEGLKALLNLQYRLQGHESPLDEVSLLILRTLYYDVLQQMYGTDLVLHPLKGRFYEADHRLSSDQTLDDTRSIACHMIDLFDETVRKEFYERKLKWLNQDDLSFQVPVLTGYVLKKCKSSSDLFKVVIETRESPAATSFRKGVSMLIQAVRERDNIMVDEILTALNRAAETWSKRLRQSGLTKNIRVTVPLINVSTEFALPDWKLGRSTGEKMLVFIHELMAHS